MGNGECIVDRCACESHPSLIVGDEVVEEVRNEGSRHSARSELVGMVGSQSRLVGHIQSDHRDVEAGSKHQIGSLRVDVDVELCGRSDVAKVDGSAHQYDPLDPFN